MKLRLAATLVLLLAQTASAQETRPGASVADRVAELALGSPQERLAAILYLEDSRSTDLNLWNKLFGYNEWGELRRDPKHMARIVQALGRVGDPSLKILLKAMYDETPGPWAPEFQRAVGLATGLFESREHLRELSSNAVPASFFAMGLMKKAPEEGPPPVPAGEPAAESRPRTGADTFTDPVEAALRWGAVIDPPVFAELAASVLTEHKTPIRVRAAVDYFARSKAKAPAAVRAALTEQLNAEDPELEGLAARALAKSEGAGDAEVAAIEAAFLAGTDRIAQVDRIRALASMKSPASAETLVRAIGLSKSDQAVRRTVMEALKGVAWDKVKPESKKTASTLVRAIALPQQGEPAPPADVRAAAVVALAAIDPARFQAALPELRLGGPWAVRAAAAAIVVTAGDPNLDAVRGFLSDPDRRVRIATLEALAEKGIKLSSEARKELVSKELGARRIASPSRYEWMLKTFDPVEISTAAGVLNAIEEPNADWFLAEAVARVPDHEVEALQSVIDLAGRTKSTEILRRYAMSPEISVRKRAKDLLAKNGVEAKELIQPTGAGSEELLDRCVERARRVFENPTPTVTVETTRGSITIQLYAIDAPATVENFRKLAKSGFYDGILWHRVVPAFVAQAGCPRGDGWGGPGYTIRCEVNDRTYRRGSVGMALAGKDTGGSQFFICHRALPHLDGRYTLFGQVVDGMDVVDKLGQDDLILKVREM